MWPFFSKMLVLSLFVGVFASCEAPAEELKVFQTECEVVGIAQHYVVVHYPDFGAMKNKPLVHDKGKTWAVDYELPEGVLGGTPTVVIDKGTLSILRSYRTQ